METMARLAHYYSWTVEGNSERTVNFHIGNAIAKLNAANKTATAV